MPAVAHADYSKLLCFSNWLSVSRKVEFDLAMTLTFDFCS